MSHGPKQISLQSIHIPKGHGLTKASFVALGVGAVGIGLTFALGGDHSGQKFFSFLTSYMFWLSVGLGSLAFVMIQHAVRAGWSPVVRRIAENWTMTLPVLALGIIPIIVGAHDMYHWTHLTPEGLIDGKPDPVLVHKSGYLDEGFFRIRAVVYVVIWSLLAFAFWRRSTKQDETGEDKISHALRWLAPAGIPLFALTLTGAAIDWMMSLEPHWYSTIYGVYYFAGSFMACYAMMIIVSITLQKLGFLQGVVTKEHYHDMGKLMYAFMIFWTYIGFSQYFLIWYANIPEETLFFKARWEGSWKYVSLFQLFGHFIFPFLFLMSRHIKRFKPTILFGAIWMLLAHWIDMYWLTQPTFGHMIDSHGATFAITDVTAFIGLGGITVGVFLHFLTRHALIPKRDPRIAESIHFENI